MAVQGYPAEDFKNSTEILYLPCADLIKNPLHMDFYLGSHLEGLVRSIKETGLLEPVLVTPAENGYLILSGHYRVLAMRRLRKKLILCRVVKCDARTGALIYCTSNLLTRGLSAIEEAYMISRLINEEKFTLEEIGKLWGHSKSWASRRVALLVRLNPRLQKDLGVGQLAPRVAQELIRLPRGNDQDRVLQLIRRNHLNKDEAGELVTLWIAATEEAKKEMEKNGRQKERVPLNVQLKSLVVGYFSQCTELLGLVSGIVEEQAELSWWPKEAYDSFRESTSRLNNILKGRFKDDQAQQ